jgi:hypothetical protein
MHDLTDVGSNDDYEVLALPKFNGHPLRGENASRSVDGETSKLAGMLDCLEKPQPTKFTFDIDNANDMASFVA